MLFLRGSSPILAIFAFIVLHRMCDSLSFTQTPANPTIVVKGENSTTVSLVWNYNLDGQERLSIKFSQIKKVDGKEVQTDIFTKLKNKSPDIPNDFKGRVELVNPATLKIRNVKERDEARYKILVIAKDGKSINDIGIDLKVLVLPVITRYENRKRVELNRNVTLSCNATGNPSPKLHWEKVGDKEKNFTKGHLLHLTYFKIEDIGAYRCIADNGLGKTANATTLVEVNCPECRIISVVIYLKLPWNSHYTNMASEKAKNLASYLSGEIYGVYGRNKKPRKVSVSNFREGSVIALVQLEFEKSINNPLGPLISETRKGTLGDIPVEGEISYQVSTTPTSSTTTDVSEAPPDTGARTSGLSEEAKWGIIGACIAVALIVTVILIICCCCRQKKNQQKGSRYETDSSFMSTKRSGLGGASPAYAQASAYRQPYNNSQEPARDGNLSYSQVSYTNAEPSQKPPRYPLPNTPPEYENATLSRQQERSDKEKEAGFELWC